MLMSDGLLRVFWPYDLPRSSSPGVIIGWRNSELDLFVLTVLEDVEVSGLSGAFVSGLRIADSSYSPEMSTTPSARGFSFGIAHIPLSASLLSVGDHRCMSSARLIRARPRLLSILRTCT